METGTVGVGKRLGMDSVSGGKGVSQVLGAVKDSAQTRDMVHIVNKDNPGEAVVSHTSGIITKCDGVVGSGALINNTEIVNKDNLLKHSSSSLSLNDGLQSDEGRRNCDVVMGSGALIKNTLIDRLHLAISPAAVPARRARPLADHRAQRALSATITAAESATDCAWTSKVDREGDKLCSRKAVLGEQYCDSCKYMAKTCAICKEPHPCYIMGSKEGSHEELKWACILHWAALAEVAEANWVQSEEANLAQKDRSVGMERITRWCDDKMASGNDLTPWHASREMNTKVAVYLGDIVKLRVQAIVNAANSTLTKGGGVDRAIHVAAGPEFTEQCTKLGRCEEGQALLVAGYQLPAEHVLITVGPRYPVRAKRAMGRATEQDVTRHGWAISVARQKLFQCYYNVLELARSANIKQVAFCGISTGIYAYPIKEAASVALLATRQWLITDDNAMHMDCIIFVQHTSEHMKVYIERMRYFFPSNGFAAKDLVNTWQAIERAIDKELGQEGVEGARGAIAIRDIKTPAPTGRREGQPKSVSWGEVWMCQLHADEDTTLRFHASDINGYQSFSNDAFIDLIIDNRRYKSVQHYYQAMKFADNQEWQDRIRESATPAIACQLGAEDKPGRDAEWRDKRERVMLRALLAKYTDHDFSRVLQSTGDCSLVYASPNPYWGEGALGKGKNRMGLLLQQVREVIRTRDPTATRVTSQEQLRMEARRGTRLKAGTTNSWLEDDPSPFLALDTVLDKLRKNEEDEIRRDEVMLKSFLEVEGINAVVAEPTIIPTITPSAITPSTITPSTITPSEAAGPEINTVAAEPIVSTRSDGMATHKRPRYEEAEVEQACATKQVRFAEVEQAGATKQVRFAETKKTETGAAADTSGLIVNSTEGDANVYFSTLMSGQSSLASLDKLQAGAEPPGILDQELKWAVLSMSCEDKLAHNVSLAKHVQEWRADYRDMAKNNIWGALAEEESAPTPSKYWAPREFGRHNHELKETDVYQVAHGRGEEGHPIYWRIRGSWTDSAADAMQGCNGYCGWNLHLRCYERTGDRSSVCGECQKEADAPCFYCGEVTACQLDEADGRAKCYLHWDAQTWQAEDHPSWRANPPDNSSWKTSTGGSTHFWQPIDEIMMAALARKAEITPAGEVYNLALADFAHVLYEPLPEQVSLLTTRRDLRESALAHGSSRDDRELYSDDMTRRSKNIKRQAQAMGSDRRHKRYKRLLMQYAGQMDRKALRYSEYLKKEQLDELRGLSLDNPGSYDGWIEEAKVNSGRRDRLVKSDHKRRRSLLNRYYLAPSRRLRLSMNPEQVARDKVVELAYLHHSKSYRKVTAAIENEPYDRKLARSVRSMNILMAGGFIPWHDCCSQDMVASGALASKVWGYIDIHNRREHLKRHRRHSLLMDRYNGSIGSRCFLSHVYKYRQVLRDVVRQYIRYVPVTCAAEQRHHPDWKAVLDGTLGKIVLTHPDWRRFMDTSVGRVVMSAADKAAIAGCRMQERKLRMSKRVFRAFKHQDMCYIRTIEGYHGPTYGDLKSVPSYPCESKQQRMVTGALGNGRRRYHHRGPSPLTREAPRLNISQMNTHVPGDFDSILRILSEEGCTQVSDNTKWLFVRTPAVDHTWKIDEKGRPVAHSNRIIAARSHLQWAIDDYLDQEVNDERTVGTEGLTERISTSKDRNFCNRDGKRSQSTLKYLGKGVDFMREEINWTEVERNIWLARRQKIMQIQQYDCLAADRGPEADCCVITLEEGLADDVRAESNLTYLDCELSASNRLTNSPTPHMKIAALVDGGASINVISPEMVAILGIQTREAMIPTRIRNAGGGISECSKKCKIYVTVQGVIQGRSIEDKALPYSVSKITLGMDCTVLPGCPVSLIIGSHAMSKFDIRDVKQEKWVTLGNDTINLKIPHMTEKAWRTRSAEVQSATHPAYSVNQLDEERASTNWRQSITMPATHRLAVMVGLLRTCQEDDTVEGGSTSEHVDLNDISFESIYELAAKLDMSEQAMRRMISEVETYARPSGVKRVDPEKPVADTMWRRISKFMSSKPKGGVEMAPDSRLPDTFWSRLRWKNDPRSCREASVNHLIQSDTTDEAAKEIILPTSGASKSFFEDMDKEDVEALRSYSKYGETNNAQAGKWCTLTKQQKALWTLNKQKFIDEDAGDEAMALRNYVARTQAEAKVALESAMEVERVRLYRDTVANQLSLRSSVEASRTILEEWGTPIDDNVSSLATGYSLEEDTDEKNEKPAAFPGDLWKYVADHIKPLVKQRWSKFDGERLAEVVEDLHKVDICPERPLSLPYVKAQCFANLDVYYHVDELNVPYVPGFEMRIHLTDDKPVVAKSFKKHAFLERIFLDMKCEDLLARNILELSESNYRSPVMLVEFPERVKAFMMEHFSNVQEALVDPANRKVILAFFRFTMNYVMLNEKTIADQHPMPNLKDVVESFSQATHYSCGDVADAFWIVALAKQDRHKTAFATHNKLLQWRCSVQGSKNAAVFFARMIATVFAKTPEDISVYQDDIFNHTIGIERHLEMQQLTYDRMRANCLVFKMSKARLNYPRLKILGHIITQAGRAPDPSKIKAILDLAVPVSPKGIRELVGMAQFNSEYIHELSSILAPLHDIMHDDCDVVADWRDDVHGHAFRTLKQRFTSAPLLAMPQIFKPWRIFVDTCTTHGRGIGAILCQWYGDTPYDNLNTDVSGKGWRPVAYWSKLLNKSQRKYSATEAEAKGLHDAILHWAPYLKIGQFEVVVDHKALEYIFNSPNITANRRILHYALDLQGFNYRVLYKNGKAHLNADGLSRLFRYEDKLDDEQEESVNFEKVTADDVRLIADKLKLDEEYLQTLIKSTDETKLAMEWVNFVTEEVGLDSKRKFCNLANERLRHHVDPESLSVDRIQALADQLDLDDELVGMLITTNPDNGGGSLTERVTYASGEVECEVVTRFCEVASSKLEHQAYCRRTNRAMLNDLDYMAGLDNLDDEEEGEDLYVNYDRIDPPRYPVHADVGDSAPQMELHHFSEEEVARNSELLGEIMAGKDVNEVLSTIVLEEQQRNLFRLARIDEDELKHTDPMVVNYVNLDEATVTNEEDDCPPTHRRIHNLLDGSVVYESLVAVGDAYPTRLRTGASSSTDYGAMNNPSRESATRSSRVRRVGRVIDPLDDNIVMRDSGVIRRRVQELTKVRASKANAKKTAPVIAKELLAEREKTADARRISKAMVKEAVEASKKDRMDKRDEDARLKAEALINNEKRKQLAGQERDIRIRADIARRKLEDARKRTDRDLAKVVKRGNEKALVQQMKDIQQENLIRAAGPRMVPTNSKALYPEYAFESESQQAIREAGESKARALADKLIGCVYQHTSTERLYEVVSVFWDDVTSMVAAYRQPADGEISTAGDLQGWMVEGIGGIEEAVLIYNEHAGIRGKHTVRWPQNEHEMKMAQLSDSYLNDIIQRIQDGERCTTQNGRNFYLPILPDGTQGALRVQAERTDVKAHMEAFSSTATAVPRCLQDSILRYYHGLGHSGINRMEDSLRLKYWWRGMRENCTNHVSRCLHCKLRKIDKRPGLLPTKRYNITQRPCQRMHVDLVGPFLETDGGYTYILVAKCPLTQWIEVVPLMTKGALEVTHAINKHIYCVHGSVEMLITDNGTEFKNDLAGAVNYLLNNTHKCTTAYHPAANGLVENQNGTLKDMLAAYTEENPSTWDRFLSVIVHAYRTTVNSATGFSPFRAMRGYEARQPSEEWIEDFRMTSQVKVSEYVEALTEALLWTWRQSAIRIRKNQEAVDNQEPEKRVRLFRPFKVGELFFMKSIPKRFMTDVLKKTWKLTRKLQYRYTGPHIVQKVMNPVVYRCLVNGKEKMVYAGKMKRDPASNTYMDAYEDDIVDIDVDIEAEHEDVEDVLLPAEYEGDDIQDDNAPDEEFPQDEDNDDGEEIVYQRGMDRDRDQDGNNDNYSDHSGYDDEPDEGLKLTPVMLGNKLILGSDHRLLFFNTDDIIVDRHGAEVDKRSLPDCFYEEDTVIKRNNWNSPSSRLYHGTDDYDDASDTQEAMNINTSPASLSEDQRHVIWQELVNNHTIMDYNSGGVGGEPPSGPEKEMSELADVEASGSDDGLIIESLELALLQAELQLDLGPYDIDFEDIHMDNSEELPSSRNRDNEDMEVVHEPMRRSSGLEDAE